jgi:hypothetical protein
MDTADASDTAPVDTPQEELPAEPEEYAIVEIFGHRRHVGRVLEVDRFGAKLLRIDVPNEGDFAKGFVSHFYGGSSIFSFTNTDLETVKKVNARRETAPGVYTPRIAYHEPDVEDFD